MTDKQLSLADVARFPRPGMSVPGSVEFTPDNRKVAYLQSVTGSLDQELWTYDLESGAEQQVTGLTSGTAQPSESRSLDEELRRERGRQRISGVTSYQFAQPAEGAPLVLLVPFDGRLYLARGGESLAPLAGCEGAIDARLSPDGSHVAFVRTGELYVVATDGAGEPRMLTNGAIDGVTNGLAEYIAQEEMGRQAGYRWSPDGTCLAFVRADSRHIPVYPIVHQGTEHVKVEEHRYPFAGAQNAIVQLGIVAIDGQPGDVTWMDLGEEKDIYLARVNWRPDGVLTALVQSRDQLTQRLLAFEAQSGAATTLLAEEGHPWLNLHDDLRFLRSGAFIWSSERTGFRHLSLHNPDGSEERVLTEGEWMVTGQVTLDEDRRLVYFQGTADGPLERHLYVVSLDGGPIRCLTQEPGWHNVVISPDCRFFVDGWNSAEQPPHLTLRDLADGTERALLFENAEITPTSLGLCVPEITNFLTHDGVLLHAAIYASEETQAAGQPRPLVVSVYGGPHGQMVINNWALTVDLRAQYLAQQGFVVLKVDNRGSANRGLAFEAPIARTMGHIEVDDQVAGVRFLSERPYVDSERVGIYGWSYGGYMVCRALTKAPEVFKAGIAGAPVTFWEGYDTHYTERYMGLPSTNAEGYLASSVLPLAKSLAGKLLLVHGLVDENVHARHTMRLIEALSAAARDYSLMLFPEARHMPRNPADLEHMERQLVEFLRRHLEQA
ncbi:peptidase S9 [Ktedonobacter sp. SOSP1-85]|uniref:S9 family peptidase n=1 Tax=Ktedonobacter sp. SOSP1-85 TaxID=2778367 RepID=UPI001915A3D5|nr:DPP IV N-terminal domain-containing protein [Ktedonobacter sp. SOSP1-85]GHO81958.1 peptidase S9 [Ktedonobacter sp. SOSP1-85]